MAEQDRRAAGRKNPPVISTLSDSELEKAWSGAQKFISPPGALGCRLWRHSTQNGYPSISQGHGKSKIKVHMLAVFMARKELPGVSEVCSHLCHRKLCCNPQHIVVEGIVENSPSQQLHAPSFDWHAKSGIFARISLAACGATRTTLVTSSPPCVIRYPQLSARYRGKSLLLSLLASRSTLNK